MDFEKHWIKRLKDFAFSQDGEFGDGEITPEMITKEIDLAIKQADREAREDSARIVESFLKYKLIVPSDIAKAIRDSIPKEGK